MRRRRKHGFTLVELMVVVIIIGVLGAIVLQRYVAHAERSKITATKTQIGIIKSAIVLFKLDSGRYPTSSEGIGALLQKPADFKGDWLKGGYLEGMPKDGWGNDFVYACPGTGEKEYDITSYGADGKAGGEDENADITN